MAASSHKFFQVNEQLQEIKNNLKKVNDNEELSRIENQLWEIVGKDSKKAMEAIQDSELLARLTSRSSFQETSFEVPINNCAQSSYSRFAWLCKNNHDIALTALTTPNLSSLLTDEDLESIHERRNDMKETIINNSKLQEKMDERFKPYLDKQNGPSFSIAGNKK